MVIEFVNVKVHLFGETITPVFSIFVFMKAVLFIVFLLFCSFNSSAQLVADDIVEQLAVAMDNRENYERQKERQLFNLKKEAAKPNLSLADQYEISKKIGNAYSKYILDSAVRYILKSAELAEKMNNIMLTNAASIQLATAYSTMGLYIESKGLLDDINSASLDDTLRGQYYRAYSAFYSHYGQSSKTTSFFHRSELYRDSVLAVMPKNSMLYRISSATKMLYGGQSDEAKARFLSLLEEVDPKNPEYATIAYFLGIIYKEEGDPELQEKFLALSAITDIKHSIKDNASLQALALCYYELGNIDKAYLFMEAAINDAIFCGVRYRTVENSSFYPIINASFQEKENYKKSTLRKYLILISVLSLILMVGIAYIYQQMKRLSNIRKELASTNKQLVDLNEDLKNSNHMLGEANHIKQEYIAHFFYVCSSYIEKIESFRNTLYKKAITNQHDALIKDLKSTNLAQTELEELYKNFDEIFLSLYPEFVEEFNKLLAPDEAVLPKQGELLNTELRIFALIRLGITDSVKISTFLRYSLRTVYNYRTKIRNKAADSRDELEQKVQKIGTFFGDK